MSHRPGPGGRPSHDPSLEMPLGPKKAREEGGGRGRVVEGGGGKGERKSGDLYRTVETLARSS